MPIHVSLLDLPPPDKLRGLTLYCALVAPIEDLYLIFDLAPLYAGQSYRGTKKHLAIAYYGHCLNLYACYAQEYIAITNRSTLCWDKVSQQFTQLTERVKTMPKSRPSKTNDTTNNNITNQEETGPVTETTTPTTAKVKDPIPTTVPNVGEVLNYEQARKDFEPMDMAVVQANVCPEYKAVLKNAIETGKQRTVQVYPTVSFLRAWIKANGLNRKRRPSHVQYLAERMRGTDDKPGFDSSCTHFVLTEDGAVANGGHSGVAILLAFYETNETNWGGLFQKDGEYQDPPFICPDWYDPSEALEWPAGYLTGNEGGVYSRQMLETMGDDFRITLVVNAPREAVLKMDDVRLQADDSDFIEMHGNLVKILEDYRLDAKSLAQYARGLYLRTAEPSTDPTTKTPRYGTLAKGGRINASEAPIRAVTFLPMILEAFAAIRNPDGNVTYAECLTRTKPDGTGALPMLGLKDVIVALAVLPETGRKRLVKGLTTNNEFATNLARRLTRPQVIAKGSSWSMPNADQIVTTLVKYGLGGPVTLPQDLDASPGEGQPAWWHQEKYRADGWDRGETNSDDKYRFEVIAEVTEAIAKKTGNPDLLESVERKAVRQERAERLASDPENRKRARSPRKA